MTSIKPQEWMDREELICMLARHNLQIVINWKTKKE